MVSEYEKEKLMAQMQSELGATTRVVLKCGVCLLILAGLAVIGATAPVDSSGVIATRYGEAEALQQARKVYAERQAESGTRVPGRGATPGVVAEASARESIGPRD